MKRTALLISILMLLTISTSGCFDVEYAKSIFLPDPPEDEMPEDSNYSLSHVFVTVITDPSSVMYTEVMEVPAYNETIFLDIIIRTSFPELPDVENETIKELMENLTFDRYCNFSIYTPNGTLHTYKYLNKTTAHPLQLPRIVAPEAGQWKVKVEASGIGIKAVDIYDSLSIKVWVHGPVPE